MAQTFLQRLSNLMPRRLRRDAPLVTVVRLTGPIGISTPLSPGMTHATVAKTLERAFSVKQAKAVALVINSPGGSPVQSHLIHQRIRSLAEEHKKKVLVFVEDVAASGGYMIACAGDEIFVDPSSIAGSIGVVSASFGFNKLLDKIGVDRRVYTAGEKKMMLDPFQPENADDIKRLKSVQKEIHALFIALVKERRGKKLKAPDRTLFSGEFWTGAES
jgi:signal peptide peptidase SppA